MSSYLLQENGDKISLEDGTGFLLLEAGVAPPPETPAATIAPHWQRIYRDEDDEALTILIALLVD